SRAPSPFPTRRSSDLFLHHRIFRADTPHDGRRGVVNLAWMATIVFLPVVTAMTGSSMPTDRVMIALYIGTLALSSWLLLVLTGLDRKSTRLNSSHVSI